MDYQYGLRPATNRMAMARGAKYMKVHNLPGWYNTGGNLFGETRVRATLTQEERNTRRKPTPVPIRVNSPLSVLNLPESVRSPETPMYTKTFNRIYHIGKNSHHRAGMGTVYTNKDGFGYIRKSGSDYRSIVNKRINSVKTSNKHGGQNVLAYVLGNKPMKKWADIRDESYLRHAPVIPNTAFNFPNANKWTTPRQSGVKMYNKRNLMTKITGSIGPNSQGMGWAKIKSNFLPLIGTRSKGGGYVINKLGKNKPAKYDDVVKGIHSFRI